MSLPTDLSSHALTILEKLVRLLEAAPAYGSVGVEVFLHAGRVVRISTSSSESTKPETSK